jgi:superoxide reductase
LSKLNKPKDWENMSEIAKKHVPTIELPETVKAKETFQVKIKVGGIDGVEHPNTLGHWINWIQLFTGDRLISRIEFNPEICDNYYVTLSITLDETSSIRAQGFCNLHGLWEGKAKKVIVK